MFLLNIGTQLSCDSRNHRPKCMIVESITIVHNSLEIISTTKTIPAYSCAMKASMLYLNQTYEQKTIAETKCPLNICL